MALLLLLCTWVLWCTIHSVLIDPFVTDLVRTKFSQLFRYYRLFYNGVSLITLLPLIVATHLMSGQPVFNWGGYGTIGRVILLTLSLSLFWSAARHYDLHYFLGIRQVKTGNSSTLLNDNDGIFEGGVFGITRHPWYLGSLLLIWSLLKDYGVTEILVGAILSIYLVIGSLLEEKKIAAEYGERYRQYQQRVSMLFPMKWLLSKKNVF